MVSHTNCIHTKLVLLKLAEKPALVNMGKIFDIYYRSVLAYLYYLRYIIPIYVCTV